MELDIAIDSRVVRTGKPFANHKLDAEVPHDVELAFSGLDPVSVHLRLVHRNQSFLVDRDYWTSQWFNVKA